MKIVVTAVGPSLDDMVEPRFGRAPWYIFVDTDTTEFEAVQNPNMAAGGGAGIQSAQLMSEYGVSHVLTGNCGPNAFQVFGAAGIQVVVGVSGTVRQAVEQFSTGSFAATNQPNVESHFGMGSGGGVQPGGMGMGGGRGSGMGRGMGMGGGQGSGMGRGMGMGGGQGSGMGRGQGSGMGRGMGMGGGQGSGMGRGMGMGGAQGTGQVIGPAGGPGDVTPQAGQTKKVLQEQLKMLQEQMKDIEKRLQKIDENE